MGNGWEETTGSVTSVAAGRGRGRGGGACGWEGVHVCMGGGQVVIIIMMQFDIAGPLFLPLCN